MAAAIDTGIAALSIEDASGVADAPLRPIDQAVERLRAARAAIDRAGGEVLLVGRAENFFVGVPDLQDTLQRLRAYAEAGADVLYAPGITTPEQIRAVVAAAGTKPVNLLVGGPTPLSRTSPHSACGGSAWGCAGARRLGRFDAGDTADHAGRSFRWPAAGGLGCGVERVVPLADSR